MGERQDANNTGGVPERVTIAEAATLLGCHPNTVRSRVRAGMYSAEKVVTERGPTWMIDRDSLTTTAPTSAPQQVVGVVPEVHSEALQQLARMIVRESGIVKDPEREAQLEGNKLAMEAAKTQLIVSSGLLVGMAAVVGVLPGSSLASPLLYVSFSLVILSVFLGIMWMRTIATMTARSEESTVGREGSGSIAFFTFGLAIFVLYVIWNSPGPGSRSPREQVLYAVGALLLSTVTAYSITFFGSWRKRRRSRTEEAKTSNTG